MASGCEYWWKDFEGTTHLCKGREHAVGTNHECSCSETKRKEKDETPGETG